MKYENTMVPLVVRQYFNRW